MYDFVKFNKISPFLALILDRASLSDATVHGGRKILHLMTIFTPVIAGIIAFFLLGLNLESLPWIGVGFEFSLAFFGIFHVIIPINFNYLPF